MKHTVRHLVAAAGFAALAIIWTFPLALHLSTHLPGAGLGDNTLFVWNFWWMRTALASGADFFQSSYLFAPVGLDLTLHTHTALPALAGATVLAGLPVVAALNVTVLAGLWLNGFCTYLLAWRTTGHFAGAVLAGLIFACSPYLAAHLNGHFNLTMAWTIPLFALTMSRALDGSAENAGSVWSALLAGATLGATAYIDYYYVVYECLIALCLLAASAWRWSVALREGRRYPAWVAAVVGIMLVIDVAVLVTILSGRGFVLTLGSVRVSMLDTYNPLQIFWLLVFVALWIALRPRISVVAREGWSWRRAVPALGAAAALFLIIAAPLALRGLALLSRAEYVTPQYFWRSAPVGVDLATVLTGNPFNSFWGRVSQRFYALGSGTNVIECGAWLGVVPLVLSALAIRRRWTDPDVRRWTAVGVVFFVWALGPHLTILGRNTGMILPEALIRYVPIVANARVPGRAIVVVMLAVAMLSAFGAGALRGRLAGAGALLALGLLTFADFFVSPFPIAPAGCSSIYDAIGRDPRGGVVAELPLPFGDGLEGELTPVDHRIFVCQTVHHQPIAGGVAARLSRRVLDRYNEDPLLAGLLRLSGLRRNLVKDGPLPDRDEARERMKADGIRYVVLDRLRASPELSVYVEQTLPLRKVSEDERLVLYVADF